MNPDELESLLHVVVGRALPATAASIAMDIGNATEDEMTANVKRRVATAMGNEILLYTARNRSRDATQVVRLRCPAKIGGLLAYHDELVSVESWCVMTPDYLSEAVISSPCFQKALAGLSSAEYDLSALQVIDGSANKQEACKVAFALLCSRIYPINGGPIYRAAAIYYASKQTDADAEPEIPSGPDLGI